MVNLHAAGASEMMRAALEGLTRPDGTRPLLIAVTQLTSTNDEALKNELLIDVPMPTVRITCSTCRAVASSPSWLTTITSAYFAYSGSRWR